MLVRIWSSGRSHSLLVGMKNGTATLEDSLEMFHKIKHALPCFSSHDPECLTKLVENFYPQKSLHISVYRKFIQGIPQVSVFIVFE